MMEQINFNRFKKATHHKKVSFVWTNPIKTKEFKTDKFYINRYGEIYSMPYFSLAVENKFYQIDENTFKAISEYGETVFNLEEVTI